MQNNRRRPFKRYETQELVNLYVWGVEPEDLDKIVKELQRRKVDTDKLMAAVEALIKRWGKKG